MWSVTTEEMCEVFSAGIDAKAFMLEVAASDEHKREGTSLVRGQSYLEDAHLGERDRRKGDCRFSVYTTGLPLRYLQ